MASLSELDGANAIYSFDDCMQLNALLDMKRDIEAYEEAKKARDKANRK